MGKQQQFGTASRDVAQIETLIEKLVRTARIIDLDIRHEEELASVSDSCDANYPTRARTLKARLDNLKATIASLEAVINA